MTDFATKYGRQVAPIYRPIPRNVVVWQGPSRLTGDAILVIATAQNANRKIGEMLQLWVVTAISPILAVRTGRDDATCGDCRLRGDLGKDRVCYVEYWRAVENIWQARGKAEVSDPQSFARRVAGLQLRLGAYGDPVAVPLAVWLPLVEAAGGWTAYTHAWRRPGAGPYKSFCMASVDTEADQREASAAGWRTFRVREPGTDLLSSEIACPYEEGRAVCATCELCRGQARQARDIAVTVHGTGAKHFGGRVLPLREAH